MTAMPPPPSTPPPSSQQPQREGRYASWGARAIAWLIDAAIVTAIGLVGIILVFVAAAGTATVTQSAPESDSVVGVVSVVLGFGLWAAALGFGVWNQGYRQGVTGQSLGKSMMNISVIRDTGQFMGPGLGIGRFLVHWIVGGACFLDYLWPLWDDRSQTWTDKIVSTVVVEAR